VIRGANATPIQINGLGGAAPMARFLLYTAILLEHA
jgi:hypothetical protein